MRINSDPKVAYEDDLNEWPDIEDGPDFNEVYDEEGDFWWYYDVYEEEHDLW